MQFKSNVCRACLSEAREIDLTALEEQFSSTYRETIWEGLCYCSELEPDKDTERMPQKICKHCLSELKAAFKFRRKCEEAEKMLRRRLRDEFELERLSRKVTEIELQIDPQDLKCEELHYDSRVEEDNLDIKPKELDNQTYGDATDDAIYCEVLINKAEDESIESTEKDTLSYYESTEDSLLDIIEKENVSDEIDAIHTTPELRSRVNRKRLKRKTKQNSDEDAEDGNCNDPSKKRHICETCGKTFVFRQNLKRHKLVHTSDRPFGCEICQKSFKSRAGIRQHMFSHSKSDIEDIEAAKKAYQEKIEEEIEKPYKCPRCPKSFARRADLRRHGYAHTEERPLRCNECGNTYKSPGNLRQHLLSHKKPEEKPSFIPMVEIPSDKPHICTMCDKSFARRHDLNRHMYVHTVERPLECEFCDKLFKTRNALRSHLYTHGRLAFEMVSLKAKERKKRSDVDRMRAIQEKRHMCDKCGKTFGRRHDLIRHEYVHTSDRPLECEICHKSFKSRGAIRQHLATHFTAFKHTCDKCMKQFAFPSALRLHMECHASNKCMGCPFCEKKFGTEYAYNKHVAHHRRKQQIP